MAAQQEMVMYSMTDTRAAHTVYLYSHPSKSVTSLGHIYMQ